MGGLGIAARLGFPGLVEEEQPARDPADAQALEGLGAACVLQEHHEVLRPERAHGQAFGERVAKGHVLSVGPRGRKEKRCARGLLCVASLRGSTSLNADFLFENCTCRR